MTQDLAVEIPPTAAIRARLDALGAWLKSRVVGKDAVADHLLIALLTDGHVLLEGAPGLAKTRIARLLATAIDGRFQRIQFTPDLLPADLIGAEIFNAAEHGFVFHRGPIFSNFLLADEINRAPAKVQSALLEAMEERQVTAGETTHRLSAPFFVVATQNPIEHDGTWDLPQAQLDRFLMQIVFDYPDTHDEHGILALALDEANTDRHAPLQPPCVLGRDELRTAQQAISGVHLSDILRDYIVRLVAATRDGGVDAVTVHLTHPISPRGTIMLARAVQARAWLAGRDHGLPEDVAALAPDVLRHRMGLSYRAEADGITPGALIAAILDAVDVV